MATRVYSLALEFNVVSTLGVHSQQAKAEVKLTYQLPNSLLHAGALRQAISYLAELRPGLLSKLNS